MADINVILKQTDRLIVTPEVVTPPVNIPPIVSAGSDKSIKLPLNQITLTGAVSDPDGLSSGLVVAWTKASGPAATIGSPAAISTAVTGLVEGVYIFKLTAKDPKGGTTSDDVTVTVLKADPIPVPGKPDYMNLPIVGPQDFSGRSNLVFENKRIVNAPGVAFKLYNGANNIIIRNCFFDGAPSGILVELENARNITIENCLFAKGWSGVYSLGSSGINIINCQFLNMKIRRSSTGAFQGLGNFIQFNSCSDMQVLNCRGENFPEADPEDMISFYRSSNGLVKGNIFRGNPTSTWSTSGGGFICGDNGGNNVVIDSNTVMNPGQYGLAIAGGTNMKIINNKIWSDKNPVSNNPLYAWAQGDQVGISSNATVTGNRGKWIDKNGGINNGWDGGRNISNLVFQYLTPITLDEMGVPDHLIDFVTPAQLLTIRGK